MRMISVMFDNQFPSWLLILRLRIYHSEQILNFNLSFPVLVFEDIASNLSLSNCLAFSLAQKVSFGPVKVQANGS